ncbi:MULTISPECIES: hypothetical protein [unclassified Streptomyces]|uniref:hypothetical protein n=1 Tax=unclassified Streptomyces TaxID=2593676 RepID=UPI0001C19427|nr:MULTISPECIES: hypothetical protein [unclassified Streptomyces]AEN10805.1 conserved hypothetical protein [Streptomyces sp. SirexAA-E]MYR69208.1 glycosyl hydrolase [Streptomyces sp. SID4939]MYS00360.1 glycosyl hydrolase [Streptomyces sp. SID4940]MYT63927.1 glycosyl hydrolase [Streptomyces sp. SID8357]MYT86177.1 glycosyl hydrolase [Streptomyces sp. SID8360]
MNDTFDFDLDDLSPADDASAEAVERFWDEDMVLLSQHRSTPHGSHSFCLAHDQSLTWGIPGAPQLVAVVVARDLSRGTFTVETSSHATASFAQNWLVERGCPPGSILVGDGFPQPGDDLTLQIEQQVRESGTRYAFLDSYTEDIDRVETWTLVRDSRAAQAPIRVFLQDWHLDAGIYTMREGAFADVGAAQTWLDERSGPLPEPPEYDDRNGPVVRARIARMALARSFGTSELPRTGPNALRTPAAALVPRPVQGRLL